MHRAKQFTLSVLLFVFSFVIIHDYIIAGVDADTQHELCYLQYDKSVLDLPSQIHDHIHILLSATEIESRPLPQPLLGEQPSDFQNNLRSRISSVPQRPPLG